MLVTDEGLRELIEQEERKSGLRPDGEVDAVAIERRRVQITSVGALVLVALVATTVVRLLGSDTRAWSLDPTLLAVVMTFVAGGFAAYAFDKERHLKRLTELGDRLLAVEKATAQRVLERAAYADDELALHESVNLAAVLDEFLARALAIVEGAEAVVLLMSDEDHARPVAARTADGSPPRLRLPGSIVQSVLGSREPFLLPLDRMWVSGSGAVRYGSVVVAPIGEGDETLGVIAVAARAGSSYAPSDLEWLTGYARRAAGAIANARAYEGALLRAEYLGQRAVATVVDELRLVAHAIDEVATRLRGEDLAGDERSLLLDGLARTGERLARTADRARAAMVEPPEGVRRANG